MASSISAQWSVLSEKSEKLHRIDRELYLSLDLKGEESKPKILNQG